MRLVTASAPCFSTASASVSPTEASSGCEYVTRGMPASSMVAGARPGDLLGDEDALLEAAVGELQAGHDVADGVRVLEVGAQPLVGEHEAALHRDALLVVAQAGGRRPATDRDEEQLGLDDVAALDGHGDAAVGRLDALERRAGAEGDAALAEGALQHLRRGLVLGGDQPGQGLDDGDLGAEGAPHARELDADDTAAEHDHRRRHPVEAQRLLGGDHALAVDLEAGQRAGVGAGGEHEVVPVYVASPTVTVTGAGHPALALDDGDPAGLDQPGEALEEPAHDAVLVGVDAGHVDAVERGADPELLGLAGRVGDLGRVQQRLRRDAADVQAGAAEVALLDEPDAQSELGGAEGTGIPTRTGPEDEDVEVISRHARPSPGW